jgi:hypothetical protein
MLQNKKVAANYWGSHYLGLRNALTSKNYSKYLSGAGMVR